VLKVVDVHTYYGDSHVLQGVSLQVEKGTVAAVLGRNGMGKTTLCRSLVGLTPARAGRILFNDTEITHLPAHKVCARGISLVPQGRRIFPSLTVREHLAIPAGKKGRELPTPSSDWDEEKVYALFPRLQARSHHRGNELSGGEQQMLAIARALMSEPRLLMLDEPSLGLSPKMADEVFDVVREINRHGVTVLLVEQNVHNALSVASRAYVVETGRIAASRDAASLLNDPALLNAYLGGEALA